MKNLERSAMKEKVLSYSLIGLMSVIYPVIIQAQDTAIPSSSFNMAFGTSSGANTSITSTAGEVLVGPSEGENTHMQSGFLVVLQQQQSALAVDEAGGLPSAYALHQNYPNPFNPSTTLQFDLPAATDIHIVVYDLLGREIVRLVEQRLEAGYHQLVWNGRDRRGREVPTGMYIVLMATPEYRKSIKLVMLK